MSEGTIDREIANDGLMRRIQDFVFTYRDFLVEAFVVSIVAGAPILIALAALSYSGMNPFAALDAWANIFTILKRL